MHTAGCRMDRIIPVVTVKQLSDTERILSALKQAGARSAEITFRTDCAAEAIAFAVRKFPELKIGAGTVVNADQASQAIAAGARFVVSPGLSEEAALVCRAHGIDYFPGCVTPTEIMRAIAMDLTTLKFFPAEFFGGLRALKALSAPFPQIRWIPTGGIDRAKAAEYLACDRVFAVGGSFPVEEALSL